MHLFHPMRLTLFACCLVLPFLLSYNSGFASAFLLKTLESELNKNFQKLKKTENPPYFLSYLLTELEENSVSASYGAINNTNKRKYRTLDTELRAGSFELDNTRPSRDRWGNWEERRMESTSFPIEDEEIAVKNILWLETDKAHKSAVEKLIKVKSEKKIKTEEEDPAPDFSKAPKETFLMEVPPLSFDPKPWGEKLKKWSALFKNYPEIYNSNLHLSAVRSVKYFVNSEGTKIQLGRHRFYLWVSAQTKAEDGMELSLYDSFDAFEEKQLPDDDAVMKKIKTLAENLLALRKAPLAEPYSGPAMLSGRAAEVFFHEILGHRIEGHRQKDDNEAKTFAKMVGQKVLPEFISLIDDPTLSQYEGTPLVGNYLYDDEGVKAERTVLVEKGILKNFLMSRSPTKDFHRSNGHGRKSYGYRATSRMGNLIVESEKTVPEEELRKMLKEEIKKKNKPYGLFFKEIKGGFALTGRMLPASFNVRPILVYKIFADERPDQLVRGVDLVGTPLTPLSKIIAAGEKKEIFNGQCGAESGYIPVSGMAPAILIEEIEMQKKEKGTEKTPILKPPLYDK